MGNYAKCGSLDKHGFATYGKLSKSICDSNISKYITINQLSGLNFGRIKFRSLLFELKFCFKQLMLVICFLDMYVHYQQSGIWDKTTP